MSTFVFDPGFLPAVPRVEGEQTFPLKNGVALTLAFAVQTGGDVTWATTSKKRELWERYREEGIRAGGPQDPPVVVSEELCWGIARLMVCQIRPKDAPEASWTPLLPEHWAVLAQRDKDAFFAIVGFLNELESQALGDLKND